MTGKITTDTMAAWCRTANEIMRSAGVRQHTIDSISAVIESHCHKKTIYDVAKELADNLKDLDTEDRTSAEALLVSKHGFGINIFIDKQQRKALSIIKKNRISTDAEYELINNLASSTDPSQDILNTYEALMVEYEDSRRPPI